MPPPTRKKTAAKESNAARFTRLAREKNLAKTEWRRLTLAFDRNREDFDALFLPQIGLRTKEVRDPFVAALRRLGDRDARLSLRHRWALELPPTPLALARLALEEAHTRAWRHLDLWPLRELIDWLEKKPFGSSPEAVELALRADIYLAGCLPREGDPAACRQAASQILEGPLMPADHDLSMPRLLAGALCWALDPATWPLVDTAVQGADLCLLAITSSSDPRIQEALPELQAEYALVRSALLGANSQHLEAERLLREGLDALPDSADPFLRLMLLLEAAGDVVHAALGFLEIDGFEISKALDHPGQPLLETSVADELAARAITGLDAERATFERAGALLDQAAPLLASVGHADQHLRHRWLAAFTRQWIDPGPAIADLAAVFRQAVSEGRQSWLLPVAGDLLLLLPRLREVEMGRRAEFLLEFHDIAPDLIEVFDRAASHTRRRSATSATQIGEKAPN